MEKMQMCRICLVKNVRMYVVVNKSMHELYEKLTDVPFVTEDSRPMLTCLFCCTKLKQCCQFLRKCLEAEELFAQMLNEDYEQDPVISQGQLSLYNGFIKTPIENINIVGVCQIESIVIKEEFKEELPEVFERVDVIIEPKQEHLSEELKLENVEISHPDVKNTEHHSERVSEYEVPIMDIKIEVEEEGESTGAPVVKKPKLDTQETKQDGANSAEKNRNENNRKLIFVSPTIQKTQNRLSNSVTKLKFKEAFAKTKPEVKNSVNNTALSTSCSNNSNEDDIKCKLSNEGIDSDDINSHRKANVKEKSFQCDICHRHFSKRYYLTRHTRIHAGKKPFKCNICQRSFNDSSHLTNHIRTHTGEKPFKCDVCQRSYNQKSHLTSHVRVHSGEEPFKCDICQRSFNQQCHLRRHIRIHTGEKPFKCKICQHSFGNNSQLTIHMRTHTGERPYKCDVCQRGFNQRVHLRNHVCVHTGERPHKCQICQRSFSLKSALSNHVNTHTRTGEDSFSFILGT